MLLLENMFLNFARYGTFKGEGEIWLNIGLPPGELNHLQGWKKLEVSHCRGSQRRGTFGFGPGTTINLNQLPVTKPCFRFHPIPGTANLVFSTGVWW